MFLLFNNLLFLKKKHNFVYMMVFNNTLVELSPHIYDRLAFANIIYLLAGQRTYIFVLIGFPE